MLADITSVARDVDSFARSRVVRLSISNPDRTSGAGSKDVLINRLLTNVINVRRNIMCNCLLDLAGSQKFNINK